MHTDVSLIRSARLITVLVVAMLAVIVVMWPRAASASGYVYPQKGSYHYQSTRHTGSAYFITKPNYRHGYYPKHQVRPKYHAQPKHYVHPKRYVPPKKTIHCKSAYVVKKGDTLSSVAARHHTTVHKLAKSNKIHDPDVIVKGQRLCVPHK